MYGRKCGSRCGWIVILASAFLLCAPWALAQVAGRWEPVYTQSGDTKVTYHTAEGVLRTDTYPVLPNPTSTQTLAGLPILWGKRYLQVEVKRTITCCMVFVDMQGAALGKGPDTVSLRQEAYAMSNAAWQPNGSGSAGASNGLGDPQQVSGANANSQLAWSRGKHVRLFDGSSGIVRLPAVSQSAIARSASPYVGGLWGATGSGATVEYKVTADSHAVRIASSLDPTRRRVLVNGVPEGRDNLPDKAGVTRADTRCPPPRDLFSVPALSVAYMPSVSGLWSADSAYAWRSDATGGVLTGRFGPGKPIDSIRVSYINPVNTVPGEKEVVSLSVRDAVDQELQADNFYVLRLHPRYDEWTTKKRIDHPLPLPRSLRSDQGPGDSWRFIMVTNITNADGSLEVAFAASQDNKENGSIGGEVGAEAKVALKANWNITVEQAVHSEVTVKTTVNLGTSRYAKVYASPTWIEYFGTAAEYGTRGYLGESPAVGRAYPNVGGRQAMSWGFVVFDVPSA